MADADIHPENIALHESNIEYYLFTILLMLV
jgi:hypothetical protein